MTEQNMIIQRAQECLQNEASAIEALIPRLGKDFLRAVEAIRDCKGKIVVTGVGKYISVRSPTLVVVSMRTNCRLTTRLQHSLRR